MPTFNSVADLQANIMKKVETALLFESGVMASTFERVLERFYDLSEFDPKRYHRTNMLAMSVQTSRVHVFDNEAEFDLWFDGHWSTGSWSDDQILWVNLQGSHGGVADGTHVWGEGIGQIESEFRDTMRRAFVYAGLPVI